MSTRTGPITTSHQERLRAALEQRGSRLLKVWRNPSDKGQVWVTFRCVNGHIQPQRGADCYGHGCYRCAQITGLATGPFLEPHNVYAWSFLDDDQALKMKIGVGNQHRAVTTWKNAADAMGTGRLELLLPTIKLLSFPTEQYVLSLLQRSDEYVYPINPAIQAPNGYTEWVPLRAYTPGLIEDIHRQFAIHWGMVCDLHGLKYVDQAPGSESLFKAAATDFLTSTPKDL